MTRKITATELARSLSDILNRVHYRGDVFIVERGGEAVCRLVPAGPARPVTLKEFSDMMEERAPLDGEYLDAVEWAVKHQGKMPKSPWD